MGGYLASQGVASSSAAGGYRLYLSWLPDSTAADASDKAVAVIETPGLPPTPRGELDTPSIQVLVRSASLIRSSSAYPDARTKAEGVKTALHALGNYTSTSGRYYPGIRAQQDPFLMHLDEQKRYVIACNYLVWRSRT